ncbi:MAG TPA: hypothetical protein PKL97_02805 [Candidatus Omnitrophota bacterium]|nr:hypothetical protein [Candidatus Omnitrophota bacterium]
MMFIKKRLLSFSGLLILILAVFSHAGCAKKADPNKAIGKVIEEANRLSPKTLESYALAYSKAIQEQQALLEDRMAQMRTMPPQDGREIRIKALRAEVLKLQINISSLMARYEIYVKKLKEKGGDVSKFPVQ